MDPIYGKFIPNSPSKTDTKDLELGNRAQRLKLIIIMIFSGEPRPTRYLDQTLLHSYVRGSSTKRRISIILRMQAISTLYKNYVKISGNETHLFYIVLYCII